MSFYSFLASEVCPHQNGSTVILWSSNELSVQELWNTCFLVDLSILTLNPKSGIQNVKTEEIGFGSGVVWVRCIWSISHTWWQKRRPSRSCSGFGLLKIEQLRSIFGRYKKSSDRPTPYQYSPLQIWGRDHYCSFTRKTTNPPQVQKFDFHIWW